MKNFKFEARNFLKSKIYLFFLVVFTLLLLWPTIKGVDKINSTSQLYAGTVRHDYIERRDLAQKQLSEWKKTPPKTAPKNPTIAELTQEVALLKPLVNAYVNEEGRTEVEKLRLDFEKYFLTELENGRVDKKISVLDQRKKVAELTYLSEHNIQSVWQPDLKVPALNRVFSTLTNYTPMIWLLMMLALEVGYYIIDDKRHATIDFINSSPTGKGLIMFNKQVVFFIGMVATLAISYGLNFLWPAVTDGFGNWQYPIVYSADGVQATPMTMATFFKWYGLYLIAIVIFLIGLSALIQLFTTNILVNLMALVSVVMLGQFNATSNKVMAMLPTSYFSILEVLVPKSGRGALLSLPAGFCLVLVSGLALSMASIILAQVRRKI